MNWRSVLRTIEGGYFATLPFLAYIAVFAKGRTAGITVMLGWTVVLVYQILFLGMLSVKSTRTYTASRLLFAVAPMLIGFRQTFLGGGIWNFFLEEMIVEVVALMAVFIGQLFFTRNAGGNTAWQDLGIVPLLVAGIIIGGLWDIMIAWWQLNVVAEHATPAALIVLGLAFVTATVNYWREISAVRTGEAPIADVFANDKRGIFLIIGQIVAWFGIGIAGGIMAA